MEQAKGKLDSRESSADTTPESDPDFTEPTMEELKTLRRVSGKINWQIMTVTFVEFCERFSYYGEPMLSYLMVEYAHLVRDQARLQSL